MEKIQIDRSLAEMIERTWRAKLGETGPDNVIHGLIKLRLALSRPAPAQDENAAFEAAYNTAVDNGWTSVKRMARQIWDTARATRSAQSEQQQAVAWQARFTSEGDNGWAYCAREHHELVKAYPSEWQGYETRELFDAPIAQVAPQPDLTVNWLVGQVCGGDSEHNTVNVALIDPAPWADLRIGVAVKLAPVQQNGAPLDQVPPVLPR